MTRTFDPPIPSAIECERLGIPVPELVLRMERDLGFETVRDFLTERGGVQLCIPSTEQVERSGQATFAATHPEVAIWLRANVGYGRIVVPLGTASQRVRQSHAIAIRLLDGASLARTAFILGVTTRRISRERNRLAKLGLLPSEKDPAR